MVHKICNNMKNLPLTLSELDFNTPVYITIAESSIPSLSSFCWLNNYLPLAVKGTKSLHREFHVFYKWRNHMSIRLPVPCNCWRQWASFPCWRNWASDQRQQCCHPWLFLWSPFHTDLCLLNQSLMDMSFSLNQHHYSFLHVLETLDSPAGMHGYVISVRRCGYAGAAIRYFPKNSSTAVYI